MYKRQTIDFPQRHHLVKKPQTSDYQQVLISLHICDILKETISTVSYTHLMEIGEDVPEWLKNGDYEFEYNIIR